MRVRQPYLRDAEDWIRRETGWAPGCTAYCVTEGYLTHLILISCFVCSVFLLAITDAGVESWES